MGLFNRKQASSEPMTWEQLEQALGVKPGQRIYDLPHVWQLAADTGTLGAGIYRAKLHPNGQISVDGVVVTKIASRSASKAASLAKARGTSPIDCYLRAENEWKVNVKV